MTEDNKPEHFEGKEALHHVVEVQSRGKLESSEPHGSETPGHISAAADAAREMAVILSLFWLVLRFLSVEEARSLPILLVVALGVLVWKVGRAAWLAWFRLERLHRLVEEERWEIEHHRDQEREELKALYRAKGFEGQLLEDVIDVLMSDADRLLRVMLEEELGLTLESFQHPLKQGIGAGAGAFTSGVFCLLILPFLPVAALITLGCAGAIGALYERNQVIPAILWNVGIGVLAISVAWFLLQYLSI